MSSNYRTYEAYVDLIADEARVREELRNLASEVRAKERDETQPDESCP